MLKSKKARETTFSVLMWIVSVVLAGFLIGLGGLIIGDLPRVSNPVTIDQFIDASELARLGAERTRLEEAEQTIVERLQQAERNLLEAQNDAESAQLSFDNWIATRTATTDPTQDPEVIARTRALDALREAERSAERIRDQISAELNAHRQLYAPIDQARYELEAAAQPRYEAARFMQELRVFALRLAFTLPLLVVALLLLLQKKKGDYWPLQRGFVLFAAFAFFVELVPYLPDYGGYVRYGVGILLTLVVGHFIVRWMRTYLAGREAAEAQAQEERQRSIEYEDALKKLAAKACPSCDRTIATTDEAPPDFCVHCGIQLHNRCTQCQARKFAFFRYCMQCGAPAGAGPARAAA